MSNFQRRDFLTGAAAFAAATTATLVGTRRAVADDKQPEPVRGQKGASIIGPTNPAREAQNLDRLAPPETDHGTMPNLRFSFADVHNRLQPGGWARQVTGRELHIAQALNCVNMRLKAGAVREMHWHAPRRVGVRAQGPGPDDGHGPAFALVRWSLNRFWKRETLMADQDHLADTIPRRPLGRTGVKVSAWGSAAITSAISKR